MRMNGNEITIQRGESFVIDRLIVNTDGSPYIIPEGIYDPKLVLRISNSKYQVDNRYVKEYVVTDLKRFESETFINIKDILDSSSSNGDPMYPDGFDNITELGSANYPGVFEGQYVAAGYYKGELTYFTPGEEVFYDVDEDGHKHYKYWPDYDSEGWVDYEFRFIMAFPSSDTMDWVPQTYYWSLTIESADSSDVIVLVSPSKLSVLSNLRGGI